MIKIFNRKKLNGKLFDNYKLKPSVLKKCLNIANLVVTELELEKHNIKVVDYVLIGSAVNFNYTKKSDIDLHILVDISNKPSKKIIKKYLADYKKIFKNDYKFSIYGFEVEIYVQDYTDENYSSAIYSLTKNKFIKKPKHKKQDIDFKAIKTQLSYIISQIRTTKGNVQKLSEILHQIYEIRQKSLKENPDNPEYAIGNLVFKILRDRNIISLIKKVIKKNTINTINNL